MQDNISFLKGRTKELIPLVLTKSHKSGYNCPFCESGTGKNGTGIVYTEGKGFFCNKCSKSYDIVNLIQGYYHLSTPKEAIDKGLELLHIDKSQALPPPPKREPLPLQEKPLKDYTPFYETYCTSIADTDYLRKRGISNEVATKAGVLYSDICKAIVFAYDKNNFLLRYITDDDSLKRYPRNNGIVGRLSDNQKGNNKLWNQGSTQPLFNMGMVAGANTLFIAEGQINCLSAIEAGQPYSIGLGSKNNVRKFYTELEQGTFDDITTFYVCLDIDAEDIAKQLVAHIRHRLPQAKAVSIAPYLIGNDSSDHDLNFLLVTKGKEELTKNITQAITKAITQDNAEAVAEIKTDNSLKGFLQGYWDTVHEVPEEPISTGFKSLDNMIQGGLFDRRLYVIGAMTGTGKTALVTQIAENIATKRDVYYFSLEMNKEELTNRLLSKHIAERLHDKESAKFMPDFKEATDSTKIRQFAKLTQAQQRRIEQAFTDIGDTGAYNHLFIQADIMNLTIDSMTETVENHYKATGVYPVVIVDYLQIVSPSRENKSTKDNIDYIIGGLKSLANKGLPVIVISSFNRDNYDKSITLSAFKESGGIEYTADIVLGLQLEGMHEYKTDSAEHKKQRLSIIEQSKKDKFSKKLELLLLKSRIGGDYKPVPFTFYCPFSYFTESLNDYRPTLY